MKKLLLAFILPVLLLNHLVHADQTQLDLVKKCEEIFSQLEELGKDKFEDRYRHYVHLPSCFALYNSSLWYSESPDRTQKLLDVISKPKTTIPVRDRFIQSEVIPQWVKDDAKRWLQGKEKDTIISYGIRYMINSKMIQVPPGLYGSTLCKFNSVCTSENDYIKYSVKNSASDDIMMITHKFEDHGIISTTETTRSGTKSGSLKIQEDGKLDKSSTYYQYVHPVPLQLGYMVNSVYLLQIKNEISFPYKNENRPAFLAVDPTGQYQEVIDKSTGVVLYIKQTNRILKSERSATLVDTNIFSKQAKIQFDEIKIPAWFRNTIKWWTEDKIADRQYLQTLGYLIKNNILKL